MALSFSLLLIINSHLFLLSKHIEVPLSLSLSWRIDGRLENSGIFRSAKVTNFISVEI